MEFHSTAKNGIEGEMPDDQELPMVRDDDALQQTEYEQVSEGIRHSVTICWEAFKTYFLVIGLLFGGYYYAEKEGTAGLRSAAGFAFPIAALLITGLAGLAISRIMAYETLLLEQGARIEKACRKRGYLTQARLVHEAGFGLDQLTMLVYIIFLVAWAIIFAVRVGSGAPIFSATP